MYQNGVGKAMSRFPFTVVYFLQFFLFLSHGKTFLFSKKSRNALTQVVPGKFKGLIQLHTNIVLIGLEREPVEHWCAETLLRANLRSSLCNSAFSDTTLVAQNAPCWECLPHRNLQMLQIRAFFLLTFKVFVLFCFWFIYLFIFMLPTRK